MKSDPSAIVCLPFALTRAERDRSRELREALAGATLATRERADGYAFELKAAPGTLRDTVEWIGLERRCCPFLTFRLEWLPGDVNPELVLTGPEGTKEFLHAEMPELPWQEAQRAGPPALT